MTRPTLFFVLMCGVAAAAQAQDVPGSRTPAATSPSQEKAGDDAQAVYALGLSLWRGLAPLDLSPAELEILERGLRDAAKGEPQVVPGNGRQLTALRKVRAPRVLEKEKARSAEYLQKSQAEPGVERTPSGLLFSELEPGTGESPSATSSVKVSFRGTLADGSEFESSGGADRPVQLRLGELIPCLREGIQRMKAGGRARLVCPASLAYADRGRPTVPPGAVVVFEVALAEILRGPSTPN